MTDRIFLIGVVALTLVAGLVGIYTVGGPVWARREILDQRRYEDLVALGDALRCWNEKVTAVLPAELTVESLRSYCDGRNILSATLTDNETGEAYQYTRVSDTEFSICAKFYDAARAERLWYSGTGQGWAFDPSKGCVTGKVRY
jgi:hypothetical protein